MIASGIAGSFIVIVLGVMAATAAGSPLGAVVFAARIVALMLAASR